MKHLFFAALLLSFFSNLAQFDTTQCDFEVIDTIQYVINKSNTPTALSVNTINESTTPANDDGYSAYGQLFEAPDTVQLNGFCFYAFMYSGTTDSVLSRVYQTNSSGEIDSLIDSMWITVPLHANYNGDLYSDSIKICATFNSPLQLIGDYVITLTNNSTSDMYIVRNGDGQGEDLSFSFYYWASNHSFDGWYRSFSAFGSAWDFDIIIEPIVSYFITTQHITNQNSNCLGDTLTISSSIAYSDSLLHHRMYNPNFNSYTPAHSFIYHYGDTVKSDTSHNYANPGAYNLFLNGVTTMSGWTFNNYTAVCPYNINVLDLQIDLGPDTSLCMDSINLTAGQFFDGYLWNTMDTTAILTLYADSLNNGVYQYAIRTEYNGCYSHDTIDITVGSLPINLGNDTTLCLNQQLELTTNSNGQHSWNTGQLTNTITVGPFNAPNSLTYTVEVEAAGCIGQDTINVVIDNCLDIYDSPAPEITTYPNPSNQYITITNDLWSAYTITISDLSGQIIMQEQGLEYQQTLDLSNISTGTYILTLSKDHQKYQQKLQIIK
ncbi:MAG: T9SS type A sorting domain-containing protein [Flavobacteriales bacterium]|jgi:hypothetical protein|nr:T9SS type A sorting domain-containing protein [Flavobacteriales bacterium]